MPVTDQYRQGLLDQLQHATPSKLKVVEDELAHQRKMDDDFMKTERWTLVGAGALAVLVIGVAVFFAMNDTEVAAAVAIVADIGAVVFLLVRRSYFIPKVE